MANLTLEQLVVLVSDELSSLRPGPARTERLKSIINRELERAISDKEKRFWQAALTQLDKPKETR